MLSQQDALPYDSSSPVENNYASVADALHDGKLHRIRSNVNRNQQQVLAGMFHSGTSFPCASNNVVVFMFTCTLCALLQVTEITLQQNYMGVAYANLCLLREVILLTYLLNLSGHYDGKLITCK